MQDRVSSEFLIFDGLAKAAKNVGYIANAIRDVGISPNVSDSNLEPANLVDVIDKLTNCIWGHAKAVEKVAVAIAINRHAKGVEEGKQNTCERGIDP
jgi:hypothetical protein